MLPSDVIYGDNITQIIRDSDALVIVTEWPEFKMLDLLQASKSMRTPVLLDFRNLYDVVRATQAGFDYYPIGRRPIVLSQLKKKTD